jgi:hypothetical protein
VDFDTENPQRRFEMHLGPFVQNLRSSDPRERRATAVVRFSLEGSEGLHPVTVTDVNNDSRDDLLFYSSALEAGDPRLGLSEPRQVDLVSRVHVYMGRTSWSSSYNVNTGPAALRVESRLCVDGPSPLDCNPLNRLVKVRQSAAFEDMNGDGAKDLILSRDIEPGSAERFMDPPGFGGLLQSSSEIDLMWGTPARAWAGSLQVKADVTLTGLGPCAAGLVGVADVTGDGAADIVTRSCSAAMPTELRVVAGRSDWPRIVAVNDGDISVPRPTPPPEPTEDPGGGGGGYLPGGSRGPVSVPAQAVIEDLNNDGVADVGIEFAGKTHFWYGGRDIGARLVAKRSSGAFLKAGYGAMQLTGSWRKVDLNADGRRDLLLSQPIDPSLLACANGVCVDNGATKVSGATVMVYSGGESTQRVLDVELDQPNAVWSAPGSVIWGVGDFNGDRNDDLLLGSSPGAFDSVYELVYGPLDTAGGR